MPSTVCIAPAVAFSLYVDARAVGRYVRSSCSECNAVEADARFEVTYGAATMAIFTFAQKSLAVFREGRRHGNAKCRRRRNGNEQRCCECDDDAEKSRNCASATTVKFRENRVSLSIKFSHQFILPSIMARFLRRSLASCAEEVRTGLPRPQPRWTALVPRLARTVRRVFFILASLDCSTHHRVRSMVFHAALLMDCGNRPSSRSDV